MRLLIPLLWLVALCGYACSFQSFGATPNLHNKDVSVDDTGSAQDQAASCGPNSAWRRVAYYEASNMHHRDCDQIWPSRLNTTGYTSIVLSFAVFNSTTFEISMEHPEDDEVYNQFFKLPLSVYKGLAIGEWAMFHDGEPRLAWSKMTSTRENRNAFVDSVKRFLDKWKFDKIEIHWEWPGASDTQNQVDLIHELRQALGSTFGISVVLPAQDAYLKNMNPGAMQDDVNWFTVLTYDLHGSWDAPAQGIKPQTDLAEVDAALSCLWSANIDPAKVLMGVANYGRGYTVADKNCNYYGCPFISASKPGSCTKHAGLLSACEIKSIVGEKNLTPHIIAGGAGVREIAWDDQWVGYDDPETLGMKLDLANKRCLGGTALWAIDFDHCDSRSGGAPQHSGIPVAPGPTPSASPVSPWPIPSSAPPTISSIQGSTPPFSAIPSSSQSFPVVSSDAASVNPSSVQGSPVPSSTQGDSSIAGPSPMSSVQGSALPSSGQWSSQTSSQPVGSSVAFPSHPGSSAQESSVAPSSVSSSTVDSSATAPSQTPVTSSLGSSVSLGTGSGSIASFSIPAMTTGESSAVWSSAASVPLVGSQTLSSSSKNPTLSWASSVEGSTTVWFPITVGQSNPASSSVSPSGSSGIPIVSWVSSVEESATVWFPITVDPSNSMPPASGAISSTDGPTTLPPLGPITRSASASAVPSGSSEIPKVSWMSSVEGSTTAWFLISVSQSDSTVPPSGMVSKISPTGLLVPLPPVGSLTSSTPPSGPSTDPNNPSKSDPPDPASSGPTNLSSSGPLPEPSTTGSTMPTSNAMEPSPVVPQPSSISPDPSGLVPAPLPTPTGVPDPKDDPDCKPNDCVLDCIKWRVVTFLLTKRPFCPCVVKTCNPDHDKKPKPTSYPKNKDKKCKLFGCGCGWMGLGFGPGCGSDDKDFDIPSPCGIFGCDPCQYFGCPGRESGIIGTDGYCFGEGCDPCPPEVCSRPGCTIAGGCGPKPGPAPTKPSNRPDPEACEDNQRTVITERFVWCTEGYNVSALPTSVMGTSSTLITSMCLPWIDATLTVCDGAIQGFDTTTTHTETKTMTSDAPACTRAPLSLDDDEGNNVPEDPLSTSSSFGSMSSKPLSTSPTASPTSSPTPPPEPTGDMDQFGIWTVRIQQYMWGDYSEMHWTLFDPNGNNAGEHDTNGNGLKKIKDYIEAINRPPRHSMPFGINVTVSDPDDLAKCCVNFEINKGVFGCDYLNDVQCRPYFTSETYIEDKPFALQTCEDACKANGKESPLSKTDLWCQDLNEADWIQMASGWKRDFTCGWKGFEGKW